MKTLRRFAGLAPLGLLLALSACASAPGAAVAPAAHQAEGGAAMAQTGVGYVGPGVETGDEPAAKPAVKEASPFQPVVIRVVGNGAAPYTNSLTPSQRKLLAMRAARLDAFRAIAEQVQGMKLVGNSAVSNMIANSDSFRTYVDAYLRGVTIVSTTMKPDGTSEAVAEITLDQQFYQQFKNTLQKTGSVAKAAQETGVVGVQCGEGNCNNARYGSNFYVNQ
ncbi:hypothetical protein CEK28_04385 [Xenophilus sp. AP218F]|nr:hypothetical protein CEK28_04385 [Xenophilus sp. AP218F]